MTPKQRAKAFAKHWYCRLPSGCDERTLAGMLEREFEEAYRAGFEKGQNLAVDAIAAVIKEHVL